MFSIAAKLRKDNHHSLAFHFPGKLSPEQREIQRRKNKMGSLVVETTKHGFRTGATSNSIHIGVCSSPAGFIVQLSHCLFCSFHCFSFYCAAEALPRFCNAPGCLLLVEKFWESAVLNSFISDNKNILIAHIEGEVIMSTAVSQKQNSCLVKVIIITEILPESLKSTYLPSHHLLYELKLSNWTFFSLKHYITHPRSCLETSSSSSSMVSLLICLNLLIRWTG